MSHREWIEAEMEKQKQTEQALAEAKSTMQMQDEAIRALSAALERENERLRREIENHGCWRCESCDGDPNADELEEEFRRDALCPPKDSNTK